VKPPPSMRDFLKDVQFENVGRSFISIQKFTTCFDHYLDLFKVKIEGMDWFHKEAFKSEFRFINDKYLLPNYPFKIRKFLELTGGTNFSDNKSNGKAIPIDEEAIAVLRQLGNVYTNDLLIY
jgi:hypothetical protein